MSNREIKFRAFETTLNEMIPMFNIDFEKKLINTNSAWRTFGEVELMQYTGLKDKNSVEIYEGDVLEWDKAEWGAEHYETVLWDYKLFSLRERDWSQFCEVIGNIYEDNELIEVNK